MDIPGAWIQLMSFLPLTRHSACADVCSVLCLSCHPAPLCVTFAVWLALGMTSSVTSLGVSGLIMLYILYEKCLLTWERQHALSRDHPVPSLPPFVTARAINKDACYCTSVVWLCLSCDLDCWSLSVQSADQSSAGKQHSQCRNKLQRFSNCWTLTRFVKHVSGCFKRI